MKKIFLIISIALTLFVVSCNKNKVAVKKLEGAWTLAKVNGSETNTFVLIEYEKCKSEGYCNGTKTIVGDSQFFIYRVANDGTTLYIKLANYTSNGLIVTGVETSQKILVLTENSLILQSENNGTYTVNEYEKK